MAMELHYTALDSAPVPSATVMLLRDALDSSAKKTCVKEAKAARESALADAKVRRKAGEERADTAEDRLEAQYAAAKARCNEMSGNAKDACVEQAKARFQQ